MLGRAVMATPAVESTPARHPGDGKWLTSTRQPGRGRRGRRKPSALSSKPPVADGTVNTGIDDQGKSDSNPGQGLHQGKERTSYQASSGKAPDSSSAVPRTITKVRPPPTFAPFQHIQTASPATPAATARTNETHTEANNHLKNSKARKSTGAMPPPHLKGKGVPPYLRGRHAQSTAKAGTDASDALSDPASQSQAVNKTTGAQPEGITTPKVADSTDEATDQSAPQPTAASSKPPASDGNNDITKKLSSVGVKVGESKPVIALPLVAYASSEEGEELPPDANTLSKRAGKQKAEDDNSPFGAGTNITQAATTLSGTQSDPQAPYPGVADRRPQLGGHAQLNNASERGNSSQRGLQSYRGRGPGARAPRQSKWLKNSEIPKGDPQRWEIKWDDREETGSRSSSCGVGDGIDTDTGFMLTDYTGSWAPAPIEWDARPAFRQHQTAETIEKWMCRIEEEMVGKKWAISENDFTTPDGTTYYFAPDPANMDLLIQGDAAPRYWVPIVIGKLSPSTFWAGLIKAPPTPFDADDLAGARPWWETYADASGSSLQPYEHPIVKGIDPRESQRERLLRENDYGSTQHAENRKQAEKAKIDATNERRKKAEEKAKKLRIAPSSLPFREIKPGLALHLRSARPEDMPRIKEIYNYYVEHTVCVPETERRTDADMLRLYEDVLKKRLPFIVACERGGQIKPRNRNQETIFLPEKIVGYIYANGHDDIKNMYRFMCNVEVYIDSSYFMKGVAKCLFDKLLGLLDPRYMERGGYDVEGRELEGEGVSRVVSDILVSVPYEKEERLEWKGRFLHEFLGLELVARTLGIGNKFGQR